MTRPLIRNLGPARDGAAAIEFAMAAPFLILLLVGILQVGLMFLAKNGLQHAVEAGARYATIYPSPTDSQISQKMLASAYGLESSGISGPTFARGTTTSGAKYINIAMTYSMTPDFIFFNSPAIELTQTRVAFQTEDSVP